jgi:hypothetical protein
MILRRQVIEEGLDHLAAIVGRIEKLRAIDQGEFFQFRRSPVGGGARPAAWRAVGGDSTVFRDFANTVDAWLSGTG